MSLTQPPLCPSLLVAATHSGVGKTFVSLALLAAFRKRGLLVRGAKLGPDYLDTQYLSAAAQTPAVNFDLWAMREQSLRYAIEQTQGDRESRTDVLIVESAMGLYDGAADGKNSGSAWAFAQRFSVPILLVLSAKGYGGASLAALLRGFLPQEHPCKLLLNHVSSARHEQILRSAFASSLPHVEIFGCLPPFSALPSRHLGLVQPSELSESKALIDRAGDWIETHIDLTHLRAFMQPMTGLSDKARSNSALLPPPAQRLAIAKDDAFRFLYEAQLQAWREAGAEITFFSPLADQPPPQRAEWIFLPGGYPELYAARLAHNRRFLDGLRSSRAQIYGECGGYMCLGRDLKDENNETHAMAGLLPLSTRCTREAKLSRMFYAHAQAQEPLFASRSFRGHVFHCARIEAGEGRFFALRDAAGQERGYTGVKAGRVCGSFLHIIDRREEGFDSCASKGAD